jgi:hypothetical protein
LVIIHIVPGARSTQHKIPYSLFVFFIYVSEWNSVVFYKYFESTQITYVQNNGIPLSLLVSTVAVALEAWIQLVGQAIPNSGCFKCLLVVVIVQTGGNCGGREAIVSVNNCFCFHGCVKDIYK